MDKGVKGERNKVRKAGTEKGEGEVEMAWER